VYVDYDGVHDVSEEHKPLYKAEEPEEPFVKRVRERFRSGRNAEEIVV
jgi:hypothetical protein